MVTTTRAVMEQDHELFGGLRDKRLGSAVSDLREAAADLKQAAAKFNATMGVQNEIATEVLGMIRAFRGTILGRMFFGGKE